MLQVPSIGLKNGPELCQKYNDNIFGQIHGVIFYLDDILITGKSKQEHDSALEKLMEAARRNNVKLNPKQIQYALREIKYIGHIFLKSGMRSDPDRIKAIIEMPELSNVKDLQRLLGMINYMRSYLPNLSELISPLRDLLKKDVV